MQGYIYKRSGWVVGGLAALGLVAMALTGCASLAPTALEQRWFTITTNFVPVCVTNTVWGTNEVIYIHTNEVGVITEKTITTFSALAVPGTNWAVAYNYQPNTNAAALGQAAGGVAGLFGPFGGIAQVAVGGIVGLWGLLRSRKSNQTSAVLAQIIETGREVLKTTPQGVQLEAKWKDWMIKHQKEQGVLLQVVGLLQNTTDNEEAKITGAKLAELIKQG